MIYRYGTGDVEFFDGHNTRFILRPCWDGRCSACGECADYTRQVRDDNTTLIVWPIVGRLCRACADDLLLMETMATD